MLDALLFLKTGNSEKAFRKVLSILKTLKDESKEG